MIDSTTDPRISLALAVRRYQLACESYERATTELNEACEALRVQAGKNARFLIQIDCRNWLVKTNAKGDLEIQKIQTL